MIRPIAMRSFVHARAVLSVFAAISASLAPVCVAHAGDDDAVEDRRRDKRELSEADEARFRALVKDGARASDEGRLNNAVKAYMKALDIRRDPLISGRVGLMLAMVDDASTQIVAANELYYAITEHAGVSRAERKGFFDAFDLVQSKICRIYTTTNDVNAVVQLDDNKPSKSYGSFWQFAEPGKHEIVGKLDGHDDVRTTIECPKGKRIEVFVDFEHRDAPIKTIESVRDRVVFVDVPPKTQELSKPISETANHRLNVALGPVVVFRAAPEPAFGVNLAANYAFDNWSAMVAAHGAWSTSTVGSGSINSFVFAAMGGPCARWKWFDGCIALNVTALQHRREENAYYLEDTESQVIPGFFAAFGINRRISSAFALRLTGDVTILADDLVISREAQGQTSSAWSGGQLLGGLSVMAVFSP